MGRQPAGEANDRDAVVANYWQIEQRWEQEQEHFLEIAVAQIGPVGQIRDQPARSPG